MAEPPFGHEPSAIAVPRVLSVGAILALTVIVTVVVIRIVLVQWITPQHTKVVARSAAIPPTPRLQPHPDRDLDALRAQKQALLSNWAWTDPRHDFARISIERAMALYVRQHAPATKGSVSAPQPQDSPP